MSIFNSKTDLMIITWINRQLDPLRLGIKPETSNEITTKKIECSSEFVKFSDYFLPVLLQIP